MSPVSRQVGIHMYSMDTSETESESATKEWVLKHVPEGQWVLQEYVMNPMTFQGHKFDLRIWAICTSLDPLRVYLMGSGIPKVSQWKYVKDKSQVKNMCVHVLFPGTAECYYSSDPLVRIIDPYPKSTTDAYWYNSVEPRGKEFWQKVVWTSVERKITELLLNAREGVLHIDHQLKRAGHRHAAPRNSGAIRRATLPLTDVLAQFDAQFDAQFSHCRTSSPPLQVQADHLPAARHGLRQPRQRVHGRGQHAGLHDRQPPQAVLRAVRRAAQFRRAIPARNSDAIPTQFRRNSLMCHPSSLRYKQQKAVFKLLGAHGYPEKGHYMDELRERARAFCRAQGCAAPMQREIHEMVHEDMHASFGWYRIFPTGDDRPHTEHFKNTRQWARSLTPMDLLMFKWLRTGWEPRHVHDRNGTVRIERADAPRGRSKYYKN